MIQTVRQTENIEHMTKAGCSLPDRAAEPSFYNYNMEKRTVIAHDPLLHVPRLYEASAMDICEFLQQFLAQSTNSIINIDSQSRKEMTYSKYTK